MYLFTKFIDSFKPDFIANLFKNKDFRVGKAFLYLLFWIIILGSLEGYFLFNNVYKEVDNLFNEHYYQVKEQLKDLTIQIKDHQLIYEGINESYQYKNELLSLIIAPNQISNSEDMYETGIYAYQDKIIINNGTKTTEPIIAASEEDKFIFDQDSFLEIDQTVKIISAIMPVLFLISLLIFLLIVYLLLIFFLSGWFWLFYDLILKIPGFNYQKILIICMYFLPIAILVNSFLAAFKIRIPLFSFLVYIILFVINLRELNRDQNSNLNNRN